MTDSSGVPVSERDFIDFVRGGGIVEAGDPMPEAYRKAATRFIEMHANSEYMGSLLERDWIGRCPSLERTLGVAAKVQDEIGHAQLLYCILEDLGRRREDVLNDLVSGRSKFHSFFHYYTESWADVGIIAWLSDTAAQGAQKALLKTSYGPYRRVLQKICWEEAFHIVHGRDIVHALVRGSSAQLRLAQEALERWWMRLLFFHGPPTPAERDADLTVWCLKSRSNEDLRQDYLSAVVPKLLELGLEIPDPALHHTPSGRWEYTAPDWDEMVAIGRGRGPASAYRISSRRVAREENRWVLETLYGSEGSK